MTLQPLFSTEWEREEYERTKLARTPVAWRVKDYSDGWIIFQNENDANTYAASIGARVQELFVTPQTK